jgi:outer membrane receptor protein involved in Fe transport
VSLVNLFRSCYLRSALGAFAVVMALFLSAGTTLLSAQSTTGSIGGRVTDPSGAVIPGADITITNVDKGIQTLVHTNRAGEYNALAMPPGAYTVSVSKSGFKVESVAAFNLNIDQRARIDVKLTAGNIDQTVSVTDSEPLLQLQGAETGQVIGERQIVDLPLEGRNFISLAFLVPGVMGGGKGSGQNTNISISGQREQGDSVQLNGVEIQGNRNNDTGLRPSVDAMQEFKVLTSAYAPEFGRASGGVILLETKAGTNKYHGDLYEFFRPNNTAANPALTGPGIEPILKQHNFGGTIGGPIIKDKAFLFLSYEGTRLITHYSYLNTVPPSQQINYLADGDVDLSGLTDPYTGLQDPIFNPFFFETNYYAQQFPNNLIPSALVSPAGKQILQKLFPAAQNGNFFNNYTTIQPYNSQNNVGNVRFDYTFSQKDRAYVTYDIEQGNVFSGDPFTGGIPIPGGGGADSGNREYSESDTVGAIYDHVFTPNLLNEVRASYYMTPYHQNSLVDGTNLATQFGIANANIPGFPQTYGFPQIQFESGDTTGGSTYEPLDFRDHNIQLVDQVSWLHGHHNFKFGYEYRLLQSTPDFSLFPVPYEYFGGPYLAFTSDPTYTYYDPSAYYANGGSEVADLLLGLPYVVDQGLQLTQAHTKANEHSFYVQDYWQITPRLNITYGVRYEYLQPFVEKNNNAANFDPATLSMQLAGRGGNSRSLINSDKNNFAPRLGVNFALNQKTSIRAGYGIFYSPENDAKEDQLTKNYPFFIQQQFVNSAYGLSYFLDQGVARPTSVAIPAGSSSIPLNTGATANQTVFYEQANIRTSYTENYNFTIQRLLTRSMSLDISYVGAESKKLPYAIGNLNTGGAISKEIGVVQTLTQAGFGNYNSLQVKFQRQFASGVSVLAGYTWSKTMDNGPGPFDIGAGTFPQNPFDLKAEYAPANYDRRHNFVGSAIFELPVGRGKWLLPNAGGVVQALVGNWQFNTVTTLQTGTPINIELTNPPNTGATIRPNIKVTNGIAANPNSGPRTVNKWFNTDAFTGLTSGQMYGDAPRNPVYGPGFNSVDMSLLKNFALPKETRLQLRFEAFNALNSAHYSAPGTNFAVQNTFGKITSGYDGRVMQFAAKFIF